MTTLGKRLQVLEERQPAGCVTCRCWNGAVVTDSFGGRSRPDYSPGCGRIVTPRLMIKPEGVRWDAV